ncbi:hypothetical protein OPT61_g9213 [Boeremia exigua]|uniref:Uncharacterized protein n=1 Tax=Boeremia exigua TaxID=749465 RepID=A0ACC2HW34_9PLEO|nr:hypothetical protein OPT61_g9213 [Boeremia exigua]
MKPYFASSLCQDGHPTFTDTSPSPTHHLHRHITFTDTSPSPNSSIFFGYQGNAWANGEPVGIAPHRQSDTVFACRVIKDVTDPTGLRFRRGMQGQYLGMSPECKDVAMVFIQGVTEGDGFNNRSIPRSCIELGKPWRTDLHDWHLTVDVATKKFDTSSWSSASLPDSTEFGKTVVRLVIAFTKSPPPFSSPEVLNFLESVDTAATSQKIIQGVKDAGLYDLFSSTKSFTVQEMMQNAKVKVVESSQSTEGGVYSRLHVANDKVKLWEKNASYLYIGKTDNFVSRNADHRLETSSYGELTRNSTFLRMFALYLLQQSEEQGLYFLAEQVLVCLLQAYQPAVLAATANAEYLKYVQSAKYFTDIAESVFSLNGWQGGVARAKHPSTLTMARIAARPYWNSGPRTPFETVIEVRKDGTAHPFGWARLPDIGGFQNWNQANSFAIRIEWQHPPESGTWRCNYVRARTLWRMIDGTIPGFIAPYWKGIMFLHWLTNSTPSRDQTWIPRASGCARVLQAKYDFMNQSISFVEQTNDIKMLSGQPQSPDVVSYLMSQPEYGLEDVGGQFGGNFSQAGGSDHVRHNKCDSCVLMAGKNQQMSSQCVQYGSTRGCTNCVGMFGRHTCSWTAGSKGLEENVAVGTPEQQVASRIASGALVCQELTTAVMPTFRQQLRQFENSEQLLDDGSDCESDEEGGVELD